MKTLIHKIVTDIKFLYPCIAYEENSSDQEIVIITETKLSKVYPIKKSVKGMTSMGEDYWGRYCFRDKNDQYYCELDGELYFKGNSMEGEPDHPVKESINYEIPDIDNELIEFEDFINKVKKYAEENSQISLVEAKPSIKIDSGNIRESKIVCSYRFILINVKNVF